MFEDEIPSAIHNYFGSSSYDPGSRSVCYPATLPFAIKLVYSDHGYLTGVSTGPNMQDEQVTQLLDHVHRNFIDTGSHGIGRYILFTWHPIQGYWRYRDQIQVSPLPADAPRPPFLYGEHPSLLEFRYSTVKEWTANGVRSANEAQKLVWLLNALGGQTVTWESPKKAAPLECWCLLPNETNWQTRYLQRGYAYSRLPIDPEHFCALDGLDPIPTLNPQLLYRNTPSTGEALRLPEDLSLAFDAFYALNPAEQNCFLRACYWLATTNTSESWSLRLVSAVQAIEVLLSRNSPAVRDVCPQCNRDRGPGPTRKFRDFLEKYAPLPEGEPDHRHNLYSVRSGLTHGGKPPFRIDMTMEFAMNPQMDDQTTMLREAIPTVRIALRNWLCRDREPVLDRKSRRSRVQSVMARSGENVTVNGNEIIREQNSG